jgi:hypothetical protein
LAVESAQRSGVPILHVLPGAHRAVDRASVAAPRGARFGVAVVISALIGMTLPSTWRLVRSAARDWPTAQKLPRSAELHPDEQRAALW